MLFYRLKKDAVFRKWQNEEHFAAHHIPTGDTVLLNSFSSLIIYWLQQESKLSPEQILEKTALELDEEITDDLELNIKRVLHNLIELHLIYISKS